MPVKKNIKNLVWCERLCRNALEIMCQLTTICNDYALNVCFCRPFLRLFFEGKNFSHEQSTGISSRKSQKPPERFAPLSHWENQYSISFHSEWDMILVTVFLSILNLFVSKSKGNWILVFSVHSIMGVMSTWDLIIVEIPNGAGI